LLNALARVLGTWFGCGYAPKAPGTAGSAGALLAAWLLYGHLVIAPIGYAVLAVLLLRPAVWAADRMARESQQKDPQAVVVDEVVGQWLTLAGATTLNWKSWLLGFVLFRLFDIWKPWPVRQMERLSGGLGIVADDAMAGLYGALVLFAAGWFNLY
jgi:phosphatidylglycerophosphatase A